MGFFNFWKKKKVNPELEIPMGNSGEIIQWVLDYLPDRYSTERQTILCKEYFENNEIGLALASLLELPNDTNHFFSDKMWEALNTVAKKLNMELEAMLCLKQIERNKKFLGWSPFFGATEEIINSNSRNLFTATKLKNKWIEERRVGDNLKKLIKKNGLHEKRRGRGGTLYAVHDGSVLELDIEMDYIIGDYEDISNWTYPEQIEMTANEKELVLAQLKKWSKR